MKQISQPYLFISLIFIVLLSFSSLANAQTPFPKVTIGIDPAQSPKDVAVTIQILILLTILTLSPSLLVLMTSFTRLVVVLHLVRQAIGLQNIPPNPVLIGLALFLTFFLMQGTISQIYETAWVPYREKEITIQEAFRLAQEPIKSFMLRQTRPKDLALMISFARLEQPQTPQQLSL
ncbi:MAG: flagellar biosynthetic protein FliP, partial [bacterium]